jgi:hypothetical protein
MIKVAKSRFVHEGSTFMINVNKETGIAKYSGLFDNAVEGGYITNKGAWFESSIMEKNFRRDAVENDKAFWDKMFADTDFDVWLEKKYKLGQVKMLQEELNEPAAEEAGTKKKKPKEK